MARSEATAIVLERINAEREHRGISKRELSQNAGFGPGYFWELLSSDKEPAFGGVMALIDALGAPPDLILLGQVSASGNVHSRPKYKEIGDRLIYLRLAHSNKSAEEWARSHGMPLAQYLLWESGHEQIDVGRAKALVEALRISLDWIYLRNPTPEETPAKRDIAPHSQGL